MVLAAIQRQAHQVASSSVLGSSSVPAGVDQGAPDGAYRLRASLSPRPAALRPQARLPVHMAEWRRVPHPSRRVGRAQRGCAAADLRQMRGGPGRASQAPHYPSPAPGLTRARIGHGDLHFATPGRVQPHTGAIEQDRGIPLLPQVTRPEPGPSDSGAGGARTHDRRIMSPRLGGSGASGIVLSWAYDLP